MFKAAAYVVLTLAMAITTPAQTPNPGLSGAVPTFAAGASPASLAATPAAAIDRIHHDQGADGTLWALGRTWKAAFSPATAAYIPAFGSAAPRNFPVAFAFEGASVDGSFLPLGLGVAPARHGDTIAYDRGGIREIYSLGLDHVEQLFEIARRPAGALTMHLRVKTDLAAAADGEGLVFSGDFGQVRYSGAVAVDARGLRTPLLTTFAAGRIEITVPAALAEAAAFPLTIDPVITTVTFQNLGTMDFINPDVAYDSGSDVYVVVYERVYSQTDHDVQCQHVSRSGQLIAGSLGYIDLSTDSWTKPRVATNRPSTQCLVVAVVSVAGGPNLVRARTRETDLAGGAYATSGAITLSSGVDSQGAVSVDVGGWSRDMEYYWGIPLPGRYFVAWEVAATPTVHRLWKTMVDPDATADMEGLLDMGLYFDDCRNPSVSAFEHSWITPEGYAGGDWYMAWDQLVGGNHDIKGARVNAFGGDQLIDFDTSSADTVRPSVSTVLKSMLNFVAVAFESLNQGVIDDVGVRVYNAVPYSSIMLRSAVNWPGAPILSRPAVESDGATFTLVTTVTPSGIGIGGSDLAVSVLNVLDPYTIRTVGFSEPYLLVAGGLTSDFAGCVAAVGYAGATGPGSFETLLAWQSNGGFLNPDDDIKGARFDAHASAGGHTIVPTACAGLQITATGTPALGQPVTYSLQNAGPVSILVLAAPAVPWAACPGCLVGLDLSLPYLAFPGPALSLSIPLDGQLVGLSAAIQGADLLGTGACSTVRVSDTVVVTIQ